MERSLLKLLVEKGIRKGETVECRAGSNIRIGRYVRGNSFTMKDAAISSKHLLIEFRDGKWVVLDLETSNGTFLNDTQIESMVPCELHSGDKIKIGEESSLKVEILEEMEGGFSIWEPGDGLKREKGGILDPVDVSEVKPAAERLKLGVEGEPEIKLRRNPRKRMGVAANNSKLGTEKSEGLVAGSEINLRRNPRRQVGGAARKGRAVKNEPDSASVAELIRDESELGQEKKGDSVGPVVIEEFRGNTRREVGRVARMESENVVVSVSEEILNGSNLGAENDREIGNAASVGDLAPDATREVGEVGAVELNLPRSCEDLEKITLGEWFDRMERHLPKKIYDISEEIISSMRTRAEQFREFLSQQDGHGKAQA